MERAPRTGRQECQEMEGLNKVNDQYKFLLLQPKYKQDRLTDIRVLVNAYLNPPIIIRKGEL